MSEAVQVIARVRPEKDDAVETMSLQDDRAIVLHPKPRDASDMLGTKRAQELQAKAFKLDRVFGPGCCQADI